MPVSPADVDHNGIVANDAHRAVRIEIDLHFGRGHGVQPGKVHVRQIGHDAQLAGVDVVQVLLLARTFTVRTWVARVT